MGVKPKFVFTVVGFFLWLVFIANSEFNITSINLGSFSLFEYIDNVHKVSSGVLSENEDYLPVYRSSNGGNYPDFIGINKNKHRNESDINNGNNQGDNTKSTVNVNPSIAYINSVSKTLCE